MDTTEPNDPRYNAFDRETFRNAFDQVSTYQKISDSLSGREMALLNDLAKEIVAAARLFWNTQGAPTPVEVARRESGALHFGGAALIVWRTRPPTPARRAAAIEELGALLAGCTKEQAERIQQRKEESLALNREVRELEKQVRAEERAQYLARHEAQRQQGLDILRDLLKRMDSFEAQLAAQKPQV